VECTEPGNAVSAGMFNSVGGTLRSQIYPEKYQSSIMSIFRVPLNLLVVIGTKLANNSKVELQQTFIYLFGLHVCAMVLQLALLLYTQRRGQLGRIRKLD
jgi:hypothetical protein